MAVVIMVIAVLHGSEGENVVIRSMGVLKCYSYMTTTMTMLPLTLSSRSRLRADLPSSTYLHSGRRLIEYSDRLPGAANLEFRSLTFFSPTMLVPQRHPCCEQNPHVGHDTVTTGDPASDLLCIVCCVLCPFGRELHL